MEVVDIRTIPHKANPAKGLLGEKAKLILSLRNQNPCMTATRIGEVDITGCVTESQSPWFVGKYGFTLSHPVLYDKPIPMRGQLGFFEPRIEVV